MGLDWDKYLMKYPNVSREEMENIRDTINGPDFCEGVFESCVLSLNEERVKEKIYGKRAIRAGPLIQVLSIVVQPMDVGKRKPLGVFGKIHSDSHYIYNREYGDIESLGPDGGSLSLIGPSLSCPSSQAFISPANTKMLTTLYDEAQNVLVEDSFNFDYSNDEFEEVKVRYSRGHQILLTLKYLSIPLAVLARLELKIFNKKSPVEVTRSCDFLNVYGRVVVQYRKTLGTYDFQEIVLFQKECNEYERVGVDVDNDLLFSNCWVAVPAYSVLVIHVNLFKYETGLRIMEKTIEFETQSYLMSSKNYFANDLLIQVGASWFPPKPQGENESQDESSDDDDDELILSIPSKEEGDVEEDLQHSWTLKPHVSKPLPSPAVEVFSIIIGREKWKEYKIYGFLQVSNDDHETKIFVKDDNDALALFERSKTIPVLEGSRLFDEFCSLTISCDLKDAGGYLNIKGYVEWDAEFLDFYHNKQLCSVIQGDHGFAALHYTVFSSAVQANLKVFYQQKNLELVEVPTVFGCIFSEYDNYVYSSPYDKNYYRILLFERAPEDSIQVDAHGMIPLSRSTIIVPSDASLVINLDLMSHMCSQRVLCTREFEIGASPVCIETDTCIVRFELEWSEVK